MTDDQLRQHLKDQLSLAPASREAREWAWALHDFEIALAVRNGTLGLANVLELVNG
jgi:hypothetical protein